MKMDTPRNIEQKNIFFEPMQELYSLIDDNINDINEERASRPTAKERQWIYPTTPEANDENYPRIALIPETVRFEEYGAGRYLQTDYTSTGDVKRDKYGRLAIVPMTIGVFCKKGQKHNAVYFDGTVHTIQNSKQSDFLGYLVANMIEKNRENFIKKNMDIKIINISTSYEDNDYLWAKSISIEIEVWDVWQTEYSDGELIRVINEVINVDLADPEVY